MTRGELMLKVADYTGKAETIRGVLNELGIPATQLNAELAFIARSPWGGLLAWQVMALEGNRS